MEKEALMNALRNCVKACNRTAYACLNQNDVQGMVDCMRATHVCTEICHALIQVLGMNYSEVADLVEYCIKVCDTCATECGKHRYAHCQECADACLKCKTACLEYLK